MKGQHGELSTELTILAPLYTLFHLIITQDLPENEVRLPNTVRTQSGPPTARGGTPLNILEGLSQVPILGISSFLDMLCNQ